MFCASVSRRNRVFFLACSCCGSTKHKLHNGQDFHEKIVSTQVYRRSLEPGKRKDSTLHVAAAHFSRTTACLVVQVADRSTQQCNTPGSLFAFFYFMAGPEASPRASLTSSLESSHAFSVSRVLSNGNGGVVASVIWLVISAGLCFPWLLKQPSATKAGETPKSVAWFLVLALDLLIGTMSVFSLWFQRSTLSIILLVWGAGGILATFVMGSFAMLPAVATM